MTLNIDELNVRSLPYETYFGEMRLTEKQKKRYIAFAEALEDGILLALALAQVYKKYNYVPNWRTVQTKFKEAFSNALKETGEETDEYIDRYIWDTAKDLTETTKNHIDDEYYTSYDRARDISENGANTVINHIEYEEAKEQGKTRKRWRTMRDNLVRDSHVVMEGITIPIDNYFVVGDSIMLHPRDISQGASLTEIIGCRCSLEYL